jgi:hypothetical protein
MNANDGYEELKAEAQARLAAQAAAAPVKNNAGTHGRATCPAC